jgi:hypothetical protein
MQILVSVVFRQDPVVDSSKSWGKSSTNTEQGATQSHRRSRHAVKPSAKRKESRFAFHVNFLSDVTWEFCSSKTRMFVAGIEAKTVKFNMPFFVCSCCCFGG